MHSKKSQQESGGEEEKQRDLCRHGRWPIFSLAHYYEQNGDLVCDPDVTFLVADQVHPLTFEQGGLVHQVAVQFKGQAIHLNEQLQRQITEFCNQWLRNVADQQL